MIETWVTKCVWVLDVYFNAPGVEKDSVYCSNFRRKDGNISQDRLVGTDDNPIVLDFYAGAGKSKKTLIDRNVMDYFVDINVLLVATVYLIYARIIRRTLYYSLQWMDKSLAKFNSGQVFQLALTELLYCLLMPQAFLLLLTESLSEVVSMAFY
jgi:hypothetical protein